MERYTEGMMDVWVLTREEGCYSDYRMDVLAITTSAGRAKELAMVIFKEDHAEAVALCEHSRAYWPQLQTTNAGAVWYQRTAEQAYPMPVLGDMTWGPNSDRPGDWHFEMDDIRWSIFRAPLDQLAPDGETYPSECPTS